MVSIFNSLNDEVEEKEIDLNDILNTKISYKSKVMDIETIFSNLKRGDFILPKFQRQFVWNKKQVASLAVSLIKNIPIPPLYLYYQKDTNKYVILDGQQRITSLFFYYNSLFYLSTEERKKIDFKEVLKKLEQNTNNDIYLEIKNKFNLVKTKFILETDEDITFEKFDDTVKRVLLRRDLEVIFVQCDQEKKANKVYSDIFKLINSAGKNLSNQEIRNGVYSDNILYDFVESFNKTNDYWRNIYGQKSSSYRDLEYLLRFLSLDYFSTYENKIFDINLPDNKLVTYSNLIDIYSELFNGNSAEYQAENNVKKLESFFSKFINIDNTKNRSLLLIEALFIAFSKLNLLDRNIQINYNKLFNNIDTNEYCISKSTSSKSEIKKRICKVIQLVKKEYYEYIESNPK